MKVPGLESLFNKVDSYLKVTGTKFDFLCIFDVMQYSNCSIWNSNTENDSELEKARSLGGKIHCKCRVPRSV